MENVALCMSQQIFKATCHIPLPIRLWTLQGQGLLRAMCSCSSGTVLLQDWGGGVAALIVSKLHQECGICACLAMLGGLHIQGLCPCAASSKGDIHSCHLTTEPLHQISKVLCLILWGSCSIIFLRTKKSTGF